jgi:alpha-glucuronidase
VDTLSRPEWNPVYYHRADANGIGFDRTRTGSNAISQYAPQIARKLADPRTTPEKELLWFHHVPWDYRLKSGETLWDGLVQHYDRGVAKVQQKRRDWEALRPAIDPERFAQTEAFLKIQEKDAKLWRDACIAYFQSISRRPLPAGAAAPEHDLEWYKALKWPFPPGQP